MWQCLFSFTGSKSPQSLIIELLFSCSLSSQELLSSLSPSSTPASGTTSASPRPTTSGNPTSGSAQARSKNPLKPLEVQRVVNIGGVKYLVVPAPGSGTTQVDQSVPSVNDKSSSAELVCYVVDTPGELGVLQLNGPGVNYTKLD